MFNILSRQPMYDQDSVQPMRDELIAVGFQELLNAQQVDDAINVNNDEVVLVFVNSVCGCAAGSARPGVSQSLQNNVIPDKIYTVFAGQERDAVDTLRQKYIKNFPPSSPCVALFKNASLIYFMQRYDIEGNSAEHISKELISVYNEICKRQGPSISPEQFAKIEYAIQCGSKIPLYEDKK